MKWPEWSGDTELLPIWRSQVLAKLRNDADALPDGEGVVMMIQQMLPTAQQPRTSGWIQKEPTRFLAHGETIWDPRRFLAHVIERCGDPEAASVALRKLVLLRQGEHQYFRDFLQEFEVLQARAEGTQVWPDAVKVNYLRQSLGREIQNRLVSVPSQPLDNYGEFVKVVADVSGRLEALPERESARRATPRLQKSFFADRVGQTGSTTAGAGHAHDTIPTRDPEGDVVMQISRLLAGLSPGNRGRGGGKPKAPWRPREEFRRLLDSGACTRCTRAGHQSRECPTFAAAPRPNGTPRQAAGLNAVGATEGAGTTEGPRMEELEEGKE
jgi:hypothetical protein